MRAGTVRVTVGDDQPLFRGAVVAALSEARDIDVVAQGEAGDMALVEIRRHRPDIAVVDVRRPHGEWASIMSALVRDRAPTRLIILSESLTGSTAYAALAAGVSACLSKCADADELRSAVRAVARGETVVSRSLVNEVLAEIPNHAMARHTVLSTRELVILELVARGHTSREIAARLFLAPSTVKTYMGRVYEKLGVHGHTSAVVEAIRRGLLSESELFGVSVDVTAAEGSDRSAAPGR